MMKQPSLKTLLLTNDSTMSKKNKFLARFLVLALLVTITACNEELYDIKEQHNGLDKNKISLTQFKKETNIGSVEPIVSISTTKSISSKTKTQLSDFVIDTLAIKRHISENNKTTYSFRIYPLTAVAKPNEIYNLVYRLVNGNWEKSIFYLLRKETATEDHKLFEKIELIYGSTINKITTSKASSFEMCVYEVPIAQCNGSCRTGVCDGLSCSTGECIVTQVRYEICSSGGSSTGGVSPDPGGTFSSGGGTPDPYSYSPNTYDNPVFDDAYLIYLARREQIWTNLGDVARGFFAKDENIGFFNKSVQYQWDKNWLPESYEFANWARNFKHENPDTSWSQVENWFMTPREGKDGDYDATYWENQSLTFPQQQLPSFQAFDTAYPRTDGAALIQLIGGDVLAAYINNPLDVRGFCALKVSRGLNGAGIIIPNLPGKTIKGGDNKYYFLNAKALNKWMRKTFGTNDGDPTTPHNPNHTHFISTQGGLNGINFPQLTANMKGIFSMVTDDPDHNWASGHADLINNGTCIFGCHFHDVPTAILDYIDIWKLN
jgi:hypothetical protein